jgi:23S rRNA (adenine2503-C2)-methyltransferase
MSRRRITVSTSGLVPEIDRLGADFGGFVQLAVSLHAADDARRAEIMPINRKHPLAELVACLRRYPLPPRRRVTIEHTLIRGVNDSPRDADAMADLLRGISVKVNLIPMNPVVESPLEAPTTATVEAFRGRLRSRGVPTYVRMRRGDDISAACGQLALRGEKSKVKRPLPTIR